MARPLRNTVSDLAKPASQSSSVISSPVRVNQAMSPSRGRRRGRPAAEEAPPPEHRVLGAQPDERADVVQQLGVVLGADRPVDPGDLVVLAVGVVVALLGAADLVAREQHRHALGQQQRGQEVALLPGPQREDRRVVGRALGAAVPGPVVVAAVPVVLAVGLVVLVVVGDQVLQGEAVVGGDEVDRGDRAPAVLLVQVAGAGEPGGELAAASRARRARSRGWCRGTCRSTRSTAAGSCRPGSRRRRRPTARRSA